MQGLESIFTVMLVVLSAIALVVFWQLILYKKVEGFTDIGFNKSVWYHAWFRYYNRFTGRVSYEYWNEHEDYSGIEIKIWHKKNGFDWKISWLKRNPGAYDLWSPYYEHSTTGFTECDDSNRNKIVTDFLLEKGVDDDP